MTRNGAKFGRKKEQAIAGLITFKYLILWWLRWKAAGLFEEGT